MAREDWVLRFDTLMANSEKEDIQHSKKIQDDLEQALKSAEKQPDGSLFAGVYTDNWLGKVTITQKSGEALFSVGPFASVTWRNELL